MCEFCKSDDLTEICCEKVDFGALGNANLSLDISGNYLYANLIGNGYNQVNIELKKDIRYCSICGRDLRKQIDETLMPPSNVFEKLQQYCKKYGVKIEDRALNFDFVIELLENVERKCLKE